MAEKTGTLLATALAYAERGWPVFPCHWIVNSRCACRKKDCESPGKHPLTLHGVNDASTDQKQIRQWWTQWPAAHIAIACGEKAGFFALDEDPDKGGDISRKSLEEEHGSLPETPRQLTGGGGVHYLFTAMQWPQNGVGIMPGLDVRSTGGYIIAAPSGHLSGKQYTWDVVADPEDIKIVQSPRWLLERIRTRHRNRPQFDSETASIPEGSRNDTLFHHGCMLRERGYNRIEIFTLLDTLNIQRCRPPLGTDEINSITDSACQYKAGLFRNGTAPTPMMQAPQQQDGLPQPITLTELLAQDLPKPVELVEGLMHEGMLLFGGKSKRGKSWLMFDLCISIAIGRSAFRHFPCHEPSPVLYLALEDGKARLQHRARAIQENLKYADNLHLLFEFPPLAEGGNELLAKMIEKHAYKLIVIDVLAKLEAPNKAKQQGEKNYHDVYTMFAPLQALRHSYHFALAMLTHLRKQEADDVFDSLHGSVAYQGAQDVLWVLERKPKDDMAFLHLRDKDAEDKTIAMRFVEGHWEYVGEGDEYEMTRDQRKVVSIMHEEQREMGPQEILKACDMPESKYGYLRKLLVMMYKDDLIHRTKHGKYSATIRGVAELAENDDDVPF